MCESAKWPPSIGLKVFKHEGILLEAKNQHSSLLCWCKSSLPWEQSLGFSGAAQESIVARPLLSGAADPPPAQLCPAPLPRRGSDTPGSTSHPSLPSGKMTPSQGQVAKTWSRSCQLKLEEFSPASRRVGDDRERSPTKLHSRKGFAFHIQYILLRWKLTLGWQEHDPESLFSYVTGTLCIFNCNLPLICVCQQPEGGIQHCSQRQVGTLNYPELWALQHLSVGEVLPRWCLQPTCTQQSLQPKVSPWTS